MAMDYDVHTDKLTAKLFRFLERAAAEGKLVTYEEMGDLVDMMPNRKPFTYRLGAISRHTWGKYGVVLTSIVVKKHTGVPSDPFFEFVNSLPEMYLITDRAEALERWAQQMREAHKHYRKDPEVPVN